jgi:hypothetical protein
MRPKSLKIEKKMMEVQPFFKGAVVYKKAPKVKNKRQQTVKRSKFSAQPF